MATYTKAELQSKVTLGAAAIFEVAPLGVNGAMPATNAYKVLSLGSEVTVGHENRTISFTNFASGGDEVEMPVGATGTVDLSEMQWIADDDALGIMETSATTPAPIAYRYKPKGNGAGKPVYEGVMSVNSWKIKSTVDGLVTVENPTISTAGKATKGVQS
ncbi:hypothetical protein GO986_16205 [Deinococcus sp. HMF7620]|uniref:Phage tail protein n=1 Tax=Deinococcus arboris TaxID=2682977 RepID=A0A7C9HT43_9DEIO|nr:hypothetical protein [Deinococcus arboris]MVN88289.1 hypothetical protein [Deinococcus arboris]